MLMTIYCRFYTRYEEEVLDQLSGSTVSLKITFQSGRIVNIPLRPSTTESKDTTPSTETDDHSTIATAEAPLATERHITDSDLPTTDPAKTTTVRMARGRSPLKLIIPAAIGSTVTVLVVVILCIRGE